MKKNKRASQDRPAQKQRKNTKASHKCTGSFNYEPIHSQQLHHTIALSQRATPNIDKKVDKMRWIKCFHTDANPESSKNFSKQNLFQASKTQILEKSETFFTSLSFKQKKLKTNKKKGSNKKLSIVEKRKCKTPTQEIFHNSKLASFHSVDCSLIQYADQDELIKYESTTGDFLNTLQNAEQRSQHEQEMRFYEKFRNKSTQTPQNEGPISKLFKTKNLISKYIYDDYYSSSSETESDFSLDKVEEQTLQKDKKQFQYSNTHQIQKSSFKKQKLVYQEEIAKKGEQYLMKVPIGKYQSFLDKKVNEIQQRKKIEIQKIEKKFDEGKITQLSMVDEKRKIKKWTSYETQNTNKVKQILRNGMKKVAVIFNKDPKIRKKNIGKSNSFSYFKVKPEKQAIKQMEEAIENPEQKKQDPFLKLKKIPSQSSHIQLTQEQKTQVFEYAFIHIIFEAIEDETTPIQFSDKICKKLKSSITYKRKKKGFNTSTKEVVKFLNRLVEHTISNKGYYEDMINILKKPIGPNPLQMLQFIRGGNDEEKKEQFTYIFDYGNFNIISKQHISEYDYGKYFDNPEAEGKRKTFLQKAQNLHNKAIFDCLNEEMDQNRPYGLVGIPFPWKNTTPPHTYTNSYIKTILEKVKSNIERFSTFGCGIMSDKEDSHFEGYTVTQEQVQFLRQDKLSALVEQDVRINDSQWYFMDDEEAQLLLSISSQIYIEMVEEFTQQLFTFQQR